MNQSDESGPVWPLLREELVLRKGSRLADGQPSWTLHDPIRNQYFQLDWLTFEILKRWSLADPGIIARQVIQQLPLSPDPQAVLDVMEFLGRNQLLQLVGVGQSKEWAEALKKRRASWWGWLVGNYLFFRVPLVNPQRFLEKLQGLFGFLFMPGFWWLSGGVLAFGLYSISQQWEVFLSTLIEMNTLSGLGGYVGTLIGVKVFHELGHGLVAVRYGCRVPAMGIAFMVLTPVAYTDTTDTWRLADRRPRLLVGAAGMIAELLVAVWSTFAWVLLPDGVLRSAAFLLCSVTWIKSLLINLSPVMRFDGYFLLSDALKIPNLHIRSFAMARWKIREWLFALGEDPPEYFSPRRSRGLVALGFFIWVYRLALFLGIALFVYQFFFKLLGVILFVVEIMFFIILPVINEVKVWIEKRREIFASSRIRWIGCLLVLLAAILCIPIPRAINVSGRLYPGEARQVHAPEAARLVAWEVEDGASVSPGAPLFILESNLLDQRAGILAAREESLEAQLKAAVSDPELVAARPILEAELIALEAQQAEVEVAFAQLRPVAPSLGIFRRADPDLGVGVTVAKGERLGTLYNQDSWLVEGYVEERYRHLLEIGASASFIPEGALTPVYRLRVSSVEVDATRELKQPFLSSEHGGSVRTRRLGQSYVPESAVYRVLFEFEREPEAVPDRIRRGRLAIRADGESIAHQFSKGVMSVLWRELGF